MENNKKIEMITLTNGELVEANKAVKLPNGLVIAKPYSLVKPGEKQFINNFLINKMELKTKENDGNRTIGIVLDTTIFGKSNYKFYLYLGKTFEEYGVKKVEVSPFGLKEKLYSALDLDDNIKLPDAVDYVNALIKSDKLFLNLTVEEQGQPNSYVNKAGETKYATNYSVVDINKAEFTKQTAVITEVDADSAWDF